MIFMDNQYSSQSKGLITKRMNPFLYVGAGVVFLSAAAGMADLVRPLVTKHDTNPAVKVEQNSVDSKVLDEDFESLNAEDFESLNALLIKKGTPVLWEGWKNE